MLKIEKNVPLIDKNWFQTGGPAKFYVEPVNEKEFQESISYANDHGLEIFVLGKGANILISDDGFDGLVIRPALNSISCQDYFEQNSPTNIDANNTQSKKTHAGAQINKNTCTCPNTNGAEQNTQNILVTAGAGVSIENLINYCLENNITGLQEFGGIPATVGGAVYINLHYFKFALSDFLVHATVIDAKTGEIKTVDKSWFNFGYDKSELINKKEFLVSATFNFHKSSDIETAYAKGRSVEIIRHRNSRYPSTHTCGSFFRNFHDNEVTQTITGTNNNTGNKMIFVAYYFDKLGIKGELKVGGAVVSHKHANMIVNNGHATSSDIINLARKMQELVKTHFGIIPQPECQLVGFKEWPLL